MGLLGQPIDSSNSATPGFRVTLSGKSAVSGTGPSRLERVLNLALRLSGAAHGLIAAADGRILAESGKAAARTDRLAALALSQPQALVSPDAQTDPRLAEPPEGVGLFAAAPVRDPAGTLLGVLAVASRERLATPDHLPAVLAELAALTADDLAEGETVQAAADREALFAEIDHRVRNVLAAIQSMASQSARRAGSLDGFLKAFTGRLKAMASAQELLTATRGRGAAIHDLVNAALSTLAPGQARWEGPDLFLTPRAANALSLALHELAVNAVKHGALASESGQVAVRWRSDEDGGFVLDWTESGGPPVAQPAGRGFGSMLIEDVTGRELDGEVRIEFGVGGVKVKVKGSAKALVPAEAAPAPTPAATLAPHEPAPEAAPCPLGAVEGMKVIIVEDAILLAMELEAGLLEAGAQVVGSAALVEEAMALVDLPMDAAVLDCNLNGLSVGPVAEALAARGVPFLFATGYGENRGAPEGFDAPIVRKPYDVAQITAALAEIAGRPRGPADQPGSASGWRSGWASTKASSSLQRSSTARIRPNGSRSTPNRTAE